MIKVLANALVVIILQCINISKQHLVYFELILMVFMNFSRLDSLQPKPWGAGIPLAEMPKGMATSTLISKNGPLGAAGM